MRGPRRLAQSIPPEARYLAVPKLRLQVIWCCAYIAFDGLGVSLLHHPSTVMESRMWNRKLLLGAFVASTFAAIAPTAQAAVEVYVNTPPPAMRYEVVPSARAGYLWAPGYWNWRNNRHVWAKGHWERERTGYFYHPHRWTERENRWYYERSRWDRNRPNGDRDGDGVPNRLDSRPDNPNRR